ncbi:MAG TPA: signal peptidase I [Solirubrobacteraceae bacterium]
MRLAGALLTLAALVLGLCVIVPALLGFQRYVITSGSMTGTYDRGALVFDRVVPTSSLRAGDVITFRPPGQVGLVTHRIVSLRTVRGRPVLRTKGDANSAPDPWGSFSLDGGEQARVAFQLPYAGFAIAALSERGVRMVVIGGPALLIALVTLAGLWRASGPEARATAP